MAKDWRGTEIEPGQTIIYGVAPGSHGVDLKVAEVVRIRPADESDLDPVEKVHVKVIAQNRGVEPSSRNRPIYLMPHLLTVVVLP